MLLNEGQCCISKLLRFRQILYFLCFIFQNGYFLLAFWKIVVITLIVHFVQNTIFKFESVG